MKQSRRRFLKRAGAAASAALVFPTIIPSRVLGTNAPSRRITLGFIGMGSQGVHANLTNFLGMEDAQVATVCDAHMSKAREARDMVHKAYGNEDCTAVQDFRAIIADTSIDAVVISTPDHWHVPISLMALAAGKDVFCEKPTLSISEGRELADAFARSGAIFQAGIEDRFRIHFHKMVEWVKNGPKGYWDPEGCYLEFQGSKGWIRRNGWTAGIEASDAQILRTRYSPEETKHWPFPPGEQRNFLDCVKSRQPTTYPALDLPHMSTTLHMGVIAIQLGRRLRWDTKAEAFLNDDEANKMRHRPSPRNWEAES